MSVYALTQPQGAKLCQETAIGVNLLQGQDLNQSEPTTLQQWMSDTASGTFAVPRFAYDFSRVPALTEMVQLSPKDKTTESVPCSTYPEAAPTQNSEPDEPAEPTTEQVEPEKEATPASGEPTTEPAAPSESLELPDFECSPTPVTLDYLTRLPGAIDHHLGLTKFRNTPYSYKFDFYRGKNLCNITSIVEGTFELNPFVYVKPGTYRYSTFTTTHSGCPEKELPVYVKVTSELAEKLKEGEIEHCEDFKRAFALSLARFNKAAREVKAEGKFPATNRDDCGEKLKTRISSKMGIEFDNFGKVTDCLLKKTLKRDTNKWHYVDVEAAPVQEPDPECTKVTYEFDPKDMLPELGKHPSKDLVKGCGE